MRIQHNIPAMNSYRNYTANNKSVAKNLEKLSSGYRINRAGDDAAGLAISEKMRAQVTGLKAAQKNAKDGISLVQTAEGALTEVHSMLNRMVELADQSANGTYDNQTDRVNLQKEITQLKSEIDRIADSTNFNGIKLLDGSLSGGGGAGSAGVSGKLGLSDAMQAIAGGYGAATAASTEITFVDGTAGATGDSYTLELADSDGTLHKMTLTIDGTDLKDAEGNVMGSVTTATPKKEEIADAFKAAIEKNKNLKDQYTVTSGSGKLTLTAKEKGASAASITMAGLSSSKAGGATATAPVITKGADAYDKLDLTKLLHANGIGAAGWDKTGTVDAKDAVIDINGQKFAVAADAASAAELVKQFGKDLNIVMFDTDADTTADALIGQINAKTGLSATNTAGVIDLKGTAGTAGTGGGGLRLQIGDTSESFNQISVSVGDMHTANLGIKNVDISDQDGAAAAIDVLKNAINQVSSTRGDLGATQNRLDHTINNLSVMTENIQDAEASIRDVDVAEEMMAYTKNNILVQSSQAMLAQANQLPQGVLQLLQ